MEKAAMHHDTAPSCEQQVSNDGSQTIFPPKAPGPSSEATFTESQVMGRSGDEPTFPVLVNFSAANGPILKKKSLKFKSDARVMDVARLLKEKLSLESVVIIVDQCFMPLPDQDLGTLYTSFQRNNALYLTYGTQAVFG